MDDIIICIKHIVQEVYDLLGPGLLENVYHDTVNIGLMKHGIHYEHQKIVPIMYLGLNTGHYFKLDTVVNREIILEFKSDKKLTDVHKQQLTRYLKMSELTKGFLINFGPTLEIIEM